MLIRLPSLSRSESFSINDTMIENYMKRGKQDISTKQITDSLIEDQKLCETKEIECQEAKDNEKSEQTTQIEMAKENQEEDQQLEKFIPIHYLKRDNDSLKRISHQSTNVLGKGF